MNIKTNEELVRLFYSHSDSNPQDDTIHWVVKHLDNSKLNGYKLDFMIASYFAHNPSPALIPLKADIFDRLHLITGITFKEFNECIEKENNLEGIYWGAAPPGVTCEDITAALNQKYEEEAKKEEAQLRDEFKSSNIHVIPAKVQKTNH